MAAVMNEPLYTIEILRLAASIPNLGRLKDAEGRAEVRSPTCGSSAVVEVTLDEDNRVAGLGLQIEACAFGQASAAVMGMNAIGKDAPQVEQALNNFAAWLDGSLNDPGDWPGLATLAPARSRRGRHGAMLLPFRGLLVAINNAIVAANSA